MVAPTKPVLYLKFLSILGGRGGGGQGGTGGGGGMGCKHFEAERLKRRGPVAGVINK